jgi:hypothetical protein
MTVVAGMSGTRARSLEIHKPMKRATASRKHRRIEIEWPTLTGRKDSAEGTLSVSDALRVFTIRTLVAAKETDANKLLIKSILTARSSRFLSTDFIL